jgi:hypothetical protein
MHTDAKWFECTRHLWQWLLAMYRDAYNTQHTEGPNLERRILSARSKQLVVDDGNGVHVIRMANVRMQHLAGITPQVDHAVIGTRQKPDARHIGNATNNIMMARDAVCRHTSRLFASKCSAMQCNAMQCSASNNKVHHIRFGNVVSTPKLDRSIGDRSNDIAVL